MIAAQVQEFLRIVLMCHQWMSKDLYREGADEFDVQSLLERCDKIGSIEIAKDSGISQKSIKKFNTKKVRVGVT